MAFMKVTPFSKEEVKKPKLVGVESKRYELVPAGQAVVLNTDFIVSITEPEFPPTITPLNEPASVIVLHDGTNLLVSGSVDTLLGRLRPMLK